MFAFAPAHQSCTDKQTIESSMLYEPQRHEALVAEAWDEGRARACIEAIVRDTQGALGADTTWPMHSLDEPADPRECHKSLYLGSSGVLWALWWLQDRGFATAGSTWAG
jgi:hypothetical protein